MSDECLKIAEMVLLTISTIAAMFSSLFAYKQIIISKQVEFYPALSLIDGEAMPEEDRGYPIMFSYKNVGKGAANLKIVHSNSRNVEIDIDNPPIAGTGDVVKIKVWIKGEKCHLLSIPIEVYYFDAFSKCYKTEAEIDIKYPKENFCERPLDLYFVSSHNIDRYNEYDYKANDKIQNYKPEENS